MRYFVVALLCIASVSVNGQQPTNPCRSNIEIESVNPNLFFFESSFHNDRLTTGYSFSVVALNNNEVQQTWRVPKELAILVATPPSPYPPCYSVVFTPDEHLDRTGQTRYTNIYKIHYDAPLGDSLWSMPGNPFKLVTTPFVGATRNGR